MSFSHRVAGLNLERRVMSPEESCDPNNPNVNPTPDEEPAEAAQTKYVLGVSQLVSVVTN